MVLCFRRPPVGRAEPAEPVTVAVRLLPGCNRAQPSVTARCGRGKAQLPIRPGRSARLAPGPSPGRVRSAASPAAGSAATTGTCRSRRRSHPCSSCPPQCPRTTAPPPRQPAADEPRRTQTESTRSRYPRPQHAECRRRRCPGSTHRYASEPSVHGAALRPGTARRTGRSECGHLHSQASCQPTGIGDRRALATAKPSSPPSPGCSVTERRRRLFPDA